MKWYFQLIILLVVALTLINATDIYGFLKYKLFWQFWKEWIEFTLNPIWSKAGVIQIYGGAETGKTLLTILLTKELKGRKWSNVPNTIDGWKHLKLKTLTKHRIGEFEDGIVGVNNVLLIDEIWNFFSQEKLNELGIEDKYLTDLLKFTTETSKTGWKVFYVTKKGIELPKYLDILDANKSAIIRTLGTRLYCQYKGRKFYYLDIEFITDPRKFDKALQTESEDSQKYVIDGDHRIKEKFSKPWWKRMFDWTNPSNGTIISIPFSQEELSLYDKTWNADSDYSKNRMISMYDKMQPDGLVEGLGYRQSRVQRLQEESEALEYVKKKPDKEMIAQLKEKGKEIAKKRGLWKTEEEKIEQEEQELKKLFDQNKITALDYKERKAKLTEKKQSLTTIKTKEQQVKEIKQIEQQQSETIDENNEEPNEDTENNSK